MSVESMIVLLTHVIFQKLSGHLNVFSKFELEWNPIEHHKGLNYHKAAQPFYFKLNLTIFRIFEGLSSVCNLLLINVNLKISLFLIIPKGLSVRYAFWLRNQR